MSSRLKPVPPKHRAPKKQRKQEDPDVLDSVLVVGPIVAGLTVLPLVAFQPSGGAALRLLAGGLLGAAGAVLLFRRLRAWTRPRPAAAVIGTAAAGVLGTGVWLGTGVAPSLAGALVVAGICVLAGAFVGLVAHDVEAFEGGGPETPGAGSWLAGVLRRVERVVSRGGERRERRRAWLRAQPFPPEWARIIDENVPLVRRLPAEDRERLYGHVLVFLDEKGFEGAGGFEVTEEVGVTIAAQACLLLLGLEDAGGYYPRLRSIVVYPHIYRPKYAWQPAAGRVAEPEVDHLGESWGHGAVVLSWQSVLNGAANVGDGRNLVLHELAHQLDQEEGGADGTPYLRRGMKAGEWRLVMTGHYEELRAAAEQGRDAWLDDYGATNPAEFFAVATEAFFEKPRGLARVHPELYAALKSYYGQDPATWPPAPHDQD